MSDAKPADASPPAKGGKKKLIIILAVVVLLLALGGGAAVYFIKKKHADEAAADDEDVAAEQVERPAKKKPHDEHPPVFVPLDNFVVNLADRDADRYLQLGVTLQVADVKVGDQIKAYLPAIRNNILLLLSRKTAKDLADAEGKEHLAFEVRVAAVRGMGIEVDDELLTPPSEAEAEPPKKKKRRRDPTLDWPIDAVQFSSLLIQ